MRRAMILGWLVPVVFLAGGCADAIYPAGQPQTLTDSIRESLWVDEWDSIKENYADLRQEIQINSADGEPLLTITENRDIYLFVRNLELDQWDYSVNEFPPDARKLCSWISSLEQNGQMVIQAVETVYCDQDGYYHMSETPGGVFQNRMSDGAARYLIALAGLEVSESVYYSEHMFYGLIDDGNACEPSDGHDDAFVTEQHTPFDALTYEGMLAASAENLIEMYREGAVIQSISDNQEVFAFLLSLNTPEWSGIDHIPESAVQECTMIRYQLGRREYAGQMREQSRLILYRDGTEYYLDILIADNGSGHGSGASVLSPQRFRVPAEVGDRLSA